MKFYTIQLLNPGPNKLQVVKAIRDTTGYGLKDSKHKTDLVPCGIISTTDRTRARKCAKALRNAGATITSKIYQP